MGYGLSADTPAAAVQWGTTPQQRCVRSRLSRLAMMVEEAGLGSPAMIVVGAVAGLDEPGAGLLPEKTLLGQRIVITRTRSQASELKMLLAEQGAWVLEAPTIVRVEPAADELAALDAAVKSLHEYQWLVLTSVGGVEALALRLAAGKLDARGLGGVKIAVVGDATAQALWEQLRIRADVVPTRFDGDALAEALVNKGDVRGHKMLLLRADLAREDLPHLLEQAGAILTQVTAYHTRIATELPEAVVKALQQGEVDWVTFTSGSTARNLVELLGGQSAAGLLKRVKCASIGPVTSGALRELGLEPAVEAEQHDVPGLVRAMLQTQQLRQQQHQQQQ
ncbi:MAG: hypothetical protein HC898_09620 [Phycisphaerales bacterium]|nr:hypothetical protein [Phycisphaerales bacterium]